MRLFLLFTAAVALLAILSPGRGKVTFVRVTPHADAPSYKIRLTEVLPGPSEK